MIYTTSFRSSSATIILFYAEMFGWREKEGLFAGFSSFTSNQFELDVIKRREGLNIWTILIWNTFMAEFFVGCGFCYEFITIGKKTVPVFSKRKYKNQNESFFYLISSQNFGAFWLYYLIF